MTSHPPAFLNAPIIRRLPATCFQPAEIDVRVRIDAEKLTLMQNGTQREITWSALATHMQIAQQKPATPKLLETYFWIHSYMSERKCSPSIEEIQKQFGLKSMNAAWKRVQGLIACGLLRKNPHRQYRNLELGRY